MREPIRTAGEKRGFALSRLLTQWAEIVGDEIAARAIPARIGYGREGMGGTLTLLVNGASAPEIQMQLPRIQDRVNACYGYTAIARIRLTQTAASGFSEDSSPFLTGSAPPSREPDRAARQTAHALSRDVGDDALRAALEALGEKVLSRRGGTKG